MKIIEIDKHTSQVDPQFYVWIRQMYNLLGSNMTSILGHDGTDWRGEAEFKKWRDEVLLIGLAKDTSHILLVDGDALRGFLSFAAPSDGTEIYLKEVQIRPSSRKDAVTFRRLIEHLVARIEMLPHMNIRTYANRRNEESQRLLLHAGFRIDLQTERGTRFITVKDALVQRLRIRNRKQNKSFLPTA
jgi:hypothetical protein